MKDIVESYVRKSDLEKYVRFVGVVTGEKKMNLFKSSDVLVLPTLKDVWGSVVNEAMMCGLPVVCSRCAGCCQYLIKEGENRLIVDHENSEELCGVISLFLSKDGDIFRSGQRSFEIIKDFTTERTTEGFVKVIEFVASSPNSGSGRGKDAKTRIL